MRPTDNPNRRPPQPRRDQPVQHRPARRPPRRRRRAHKTAARLAVLAVSVAAVVGLAWAITLFIERGAGSPLVPSGASHPANQYGYAEARPQSGPAHSWMPAVNTETWNHVGPLAARAEVMEVLTPDAKMIALPENGRVDMRYFDTALILGDSLAQGFAPGGIHHSGYGVLADTGAKYCTYRGISLMQMFNGTAHINQDGVEEVPMDALTAYAPDNVYISMGANAMLAIPENDIFLEAYGQLLDTIRERLGPDAGIYVMSITPISEWTTEFDKDRILALNNYLAKLVWEKGAYFIDTHEALANEAGWMREDFAAADGYHLKDKNAYNAWLDYLLTHTVYNTRHAAHYLEGSPYYTQQPRREETA